LNNKIKKIFIGIAVFSIMALAFTACQKDNTIVTPRKMESQLTPQ